jgi:hypothetical protein
MLSLNVCSPQERKKLTGGPGCIARPIVCIIPAIENELKSSALMKGIAADKEEELLNLHT